MRGRTVAVGDELGPVELHLSLQRLVMLAGATRDFAPHHHDPDLAGQMGAPAPFGNTLFVLALIERLLREWGGPGLAIQRLGPYRMRSFIAQDADVVARGRVERVSGRRVTVEWWIEVGADHDKARGTAELELAG